MKTKNKINLAAIAALSLLFVNCDSDPQSEELNEQSLVAEVQAPFSEADAENYPLENPELTEIHQYFGVPTDFNQLEDGTLVLGDMLFHPEHVEETNNIDSRGTILNNPARRWPKVGAFYRVYYKIDPDLPNKSRVYQAMNHWKNNTRIRFVERTTQANYVYFTDDGGCYSYIGKIGGQQTISVGSGCTRGNTIHEIGHAVGMYHEQSHPARNNFVTIKWNNIRPGYEGNFSRQAWSNVKTSSFNLGSVMMYGSYFWSKNGQPTITRKNGSTFNIQRNGLSNKDKQAIAKIYKP